MFVIFFLPHATKNIIYSQVSRVRPALRGDGGAFDDDGCGSIGFAPSTSHGCFFGVSVVDDVEAFRLDATTAGERGELRCSLALLR